VETSGLRRRLGSAADRAAYRILQEALTNAARHGTGGAQVELAYGEATVDLTVTNPVGDVGDGSSTGGAIPTGGATRNGGGHGLPGMRERATLLGGDFRAERVDGTFRVHACIPLGPVQPA
jgi:signal transduction histidine kinase